MGQTLPHITIKPELTSLAVPSQRALAEPGSADEEKRIVALLHRFHSQYGHSFCPPGFRYHDVVIDTWLAPRRRQWRERPETLTETVRYAFTTHDVAPHNLALETLQMIEIYKAYRLEFPWMCVTPHTVYRNVPLGHWWQQVCADRPWWSVILEHIDPHWASPERAVRAQPLPSRYDTLVTWQGTKLVWKQTENEPPPKPFDRFAGTGKPNTHWRRMFVALEAYRDAHGHMFMSYNYRAGSLPLGNWVYAQRKRLAHRDAITRPTMIHRHDLLDAIGFPWETISAMWLRSYAIARRFRETHGHLRPTKGEYFEGLDLYSWVVRQRQILGVSGDAPNKMLRRTMLDAIDFPWQARPVPRLDDTVIEASTLHDQAWEAKFAIWTDYVSSHSFLGYHRGLVHRGVAIGRWLRYQRNALAGDKLSSTAQRRKKRLEATGFDFETARKRINQARWYRRFELCRRYQEENGELLNLHHPVTAEGIDLIAWLRRQLYLYREPPHDHIGNEMRRLLDTLELDITPARCRLGFIDWHARFQYWLHLQGRPCLIPARCKAGLDLSEWHTRQQALLVAPDPLTTPQQIKRKLLQEVGYPDTAVSPRPDPMSSRAPDAKSVATPG